MMENVCPSHGLVWFGGEGGTGVERNWGNAGVERRWEDGRMSEMRGGKSRRICTDIIIAELQITLRSCMSKSSHPQKMKRKMYGLFNKREKQL